ncbi:hypothetical protein [Helicobacter sp. 23-1045]
MLDSAVLSSLRGLLQCESYRSTSSLRVLAIARRSNLFKATFGLGQMWVLWRI